MATAIANGETSAPHNEYQSPDQYDLSQARSAVQTVASPTPHLDTDPSVDPAKSLESTNLAPEHSLNDLSPSAQPPSKSDQQVQSRTMSRASSSDASSGLDIVTDIQTKSQVSPQHSTSASTPMPNGTSAPASASSPVAVPVTASNLSHSDSVAQGVHSSDSVPSKMPEANAEAAEGVTPRDSPAPSITQMRSPRPTAANSSTPLPKARLPHDLLGILEDRIKDDPRGDVEAWLALIEEHKKKGKMDEARAVYERFLALFPSAAEVWVSYAQMENAVPDNRSGVSRVLGKSLMEVPSLAIWSFYIDHVRRYQNLITEPEASRKTIHQAFDLALQTVGLDKDSGRLWQDYVTFIKSGPGIIGGSNWQDSQKMDLLRKTYQRAICVPTQATNVLWKEYDAFEMGLNKTTGRKFLQDQSPAYMSARSCYTELQNITRDLQRTSLPTLPPAPGFQGDVEFTNQLNIWKRWIEWERNDPLVLKQEDMEAYKSRVLFVYKHAVMAMRFWPELWCDASEFCFANGFDKEGNEFLNKGIAANPESCLLAFKRADRVELTAGNDEGDEKHTRRAAAVREPYDKVLHALYDMISKTKAREDVDVARTEAQFAADLQSQTNGQTEKEDDEEDESEAQTAQKLKQKDAQVEAIHNMHAAQTRLLSQTLSHVWIALMRAMRRVQGKGGVNGGGARGVFSEARKRGRITPDVYVHAALIEFHCYDPDTGKKIFDRGLKLFPEDERFALEYIQHLVAINDHTNARVVFETVVTRLAQKSTTVEKAKPLYFFFHNFESHYGELTQIVKLEKRMRDLFPEDAALTLFAKRFASNGVEPTLIRPIVSPAKQMRPKNIPEIKTIADPRPTPQIQASNSPKRSLPFDVADEEPDRPRKIQRGESPMKPMSTQPMAKSNSQQQHNTPTQISRPPPLPMPHPLPPLPRDVNYLLSIIPKASTYQATKFDPGALVRLIRETNVPNHISQLPSQAGGRVPVAGPAPPVHHVPPPSMPGSTQPYHQHGAVPPMQQRPGLPPMPQLQHMQPLGYPQYGQPPAGPYVYGR